MQLWKRFLLTVTVMIGVLYAPIGAVGMMASCECLKDQTTHASKKDDSSSTRSCCQREKPLAAQAQISNKSACCCSLTPTAPYTKVRVSAVKVAEKAADVANSTVLQYSETVKVLDSGALALHPPKAIWIWNCSQLC